MKKTLDDWKSFGKLLMWGFLISMFCWMMGSSIYVGSGCNKSNIEMSERP